MTVHRFELEEQPRGPLRIWSLPTEGTSYVVGADPAGGKERQDWSAAIVLEAHTWNIVATLHGHWEPSEFAQEVLQLCQFYGDEDGPAYLVPEINNHGLAFTDKIRDLGHTRIYTRREYSSVEQDWIGVLGFQSSVKTRPRLIRHCREALSNLAIKIRDPRLLEECQVFIRTESGREEASPGKHDDLIMAWGLAIEGAVQHGVAPIAVDGPGADQEDGARKDSRSAAVWEWVNDEIQNQDADDDEAPALIFGSEDDWDEDDW